MELHTFKSIIFIFILLKLVATSSETSEQNDVPIHNIAQFTKELTENIHNSHKYKKQSNNFLNSRVFPDSININNIDLLESFLKIIGNGDSNSKCSQDLLYLVRHIKLQDPQNQWALKMLDSFGKPEGGILTGNTKWLGDFNECRSIYAPKDVTSDAGGFHGKYCTAQIPLLIFSISLGICLPDSCNPADFPNLNSTFFNNSNSTPDQKNLQSILQLISCKTNTKQLTHGAIATICLMSIFVFLVLIGSSITVIRYIISVWYDKDTLCEIHANGKVTAVNDDMESQAHGDDIVLITEGSRTKLSVFIEKCDPFFNCFCFFTNGAKLLNTDSTEGQMLCLHGIRFLSMSWVILCHCYGAPMSMLRTMLNVPSLVDNLPFQAILNGFFSVDSFFVLSGFLMAFLYFQKASKNNGSIPWVYFYVHRYLRLTPVYMMVLAFFTTIAPYIGSGPFWNDYDTDPMCQKNWWWNLIYINNFKSMGEQCMAWSWYLANDMQFFVISPLFLISLWRWPIIGYAILGLFFCGYWTTSFVITYQYGLPAGIGNINDAASPAFALKFLDYFDKYYTKPYTRIGPYLVGIVLAYIIFKRSITKKRISFAALCIGWIVATAVGLICVYGLYYKAPSILGASFYNSLCRICYAGSLSWVIFVCLSGQGGPVDKILSFKLFIPLSRLTYTAYLIHLIIISSYFGSMKTTLDFSHVTMVTLFLGLIVVTYAISLLVSLVFESPIIRLEKLVRSKFQS